MMRRMLLAGRLDGQAAALARLQHLVRECRPDAVLFAGGILDGALPGGQRLKQWETLLSEFGKLGVFTAMIPGPADVPLSGFLRAAINAEVDSPNLHVAHGTVFDEGDVAVSGLGGELTEAEECTGERLCYARASAEYFLRALWRADQAHKVMLLSVPPPGQLGGEGGDPICGDLIDSWHPSLCVVAGTTERRGFQRIAHTLVVNPGRLSDGSAAWLDWSRDRDEQLEFLNA